jgi:hypothetical protein
MPDDLLKRLRRLLEVLVAVRSFTGMITHVSRMASAFSHFTCV